MYFYLSKILTPLLNPTNLLFFVILFTSIIYFITKKKFLFNFFTINVLILFLIAFSPIGNIGLKYLENNFINQKEYKNIKNIIVLSGSDKRIIASIKFANKFKNSQIYFVGGNAYMIKDNRNNEPSKALNLYNDLNFNLKRITFVGKSRNTIENFKKIKKLNLVSSESILITSAFHMKRSMMIADKLDLNFKTYASDFRSFSQKSLINKYQSFNVTRNLSQFNLFFREILAILVFKIIT